MGKFPTSRDGVLGEEYNFADVSITLGNLYQGRFCNEMIVD